ncbi:MAG: hypothetical protein JNK78_10155 [Planctomycetes bacterium]|nr:hypothetical protein [Planctomycetota bacterium]
MRAVPTIGIVCLVSAMLPAQDPNGGAASHLAFGQGCHESARDSFFVLLPDAAVASLVLTGRSLELHPSGLGYVGSWGMGGYLQPGANAALLPPSDDGQVAVALPRPLPTLDGAASTIWVHSNGIVATGPGIDGGAWNSPPNDFTPSPRFAAAPDTAFFAWHDWNPAEPGSGRITTHEAVAGGESWFCVTWRDVENFPAGVPNRGTFQFQFGLDSGRVRYVWVAVDGATSSPFGSAHLVGYSPGGPSLVPPPLHVGDSIVTSPDLRSLGLAAAPPPVSTSEAGTLVHYTMVDAPEAIVGSGVRLGFLALAASEVAGGIDLAALGAPGCASYLASFDVVFFAVAPAATIRFDVSFPPAMPPGTTIHAQAIALVTPFVVGDLANTLGVVTSNGLSSRVGDH